MNLNRLDSFSQFHSEIFFLRIEVGKAITGRAKTKVH